MFSHLFSQLPLPTKIFYNEVPHSLHNDYNYYRRVKISQYFHPSRWNQARYNPVFLRRHSLHRHITTHFKIQIWLSVYVEYLRLYFVLMEVSAWVKEALENVSKGICKELKCALNKLKALQESPPRHLYYCMKLQFFSKLCHQTICFLHGVQCEKEPYYLVTSLYVIDGFSVTMISCVYQPKMTPAKDAWYSYFIQA